MSLNPDIITVVRRLETAVSKISEFTAGNNEVAGYFLEEKGPATTLPNQERRIPPGTYKLRWHNSPRFRATLPHLFNEHVPIGRYILIHPGNTAAHTEGCLLPGKIFAKDRVDSSRPMVAATIGYLRSRGIGNVSLVIREEFQ